MNLNRLKLKDKKLIDKFLRSSSCSLCVSSFANIYIWSGLFEIYWALKDKSLFIFFKGKGGCFLYLPPLGESVKPGNIEEAFGVMDRFNKNRTVSRIENAQEKDIPFYKRLGYACTEKSCDYICEKDGIALFKGKNLKAKRKYLNYFLKHYSFRYLPFSPKYKDSCLKLYRRWMEKRRAKYDENVYRYMLEDNLASLKVALENYSRLGLTGRVVEISGELKAFTFGFRLNRDTFCILYETTDLDIKGLSQFIFSRFSSEASGCRYINIMDDSGLANLKKSKLSYHPVKLIPSYLITRSV